MGEEPEDPGSSEEAEENGDLIDDLDSLLEEEGLDDADLEDLFEEEEESAETEQRALRIQQSNREARLERRLQDRLEYENLEGLMAHGPLDLIISEDRLLARINRIDLDTTQEQIEALLKGYGVVQGVDYMGIQDGLVKASRGQMQHGVIVAKGRPPRVLQEARIRYREGLRGREKYFSRLRELIHEGTNPDGFYGWREPMPVVCPGEVLAELISPEVEPGEDVFGHPLTLEIEEAQALWAGDNASMTADGRTCLAEIFGYAGIADGDPTVLPPIWVSPDKMEVRFVYLPSVDSVARPPTLEEIHHLLQLCWIEYGILEEEVERIADRLQRGLSVPPALLIGQGDLPVPGEAAQIRYAFAAHDLPDWARLNALMSSRTTEELEERVEELVTAAAGQPLCQGVRSGQVIAEKIPATEGVAGRDVEGEEIVPEEGADLPLEMGENVELTEDDLRCLAAVAGYACLRFDQINLIPPLWISSDKRVAYFVNLSQGSAPVYPSLEEMYDLLALFSITHGFEGKRWIETLAGLENGELKQALIPVAEGTATQPGRDATFDWAVEIEKNRVGKVLADGSIDFRERNLATVVREGDLLGRLVPAQEGRPGIDVLGNEIQPPRPVNIEVLTDARISSHEVEDGEGGLEFIAETGGGVTQQVELKRSKQRVRRRIRIGISPITNIDGDVDYSTGNIDFHGDVVIRGSVQSLFSVKATGDVSIGGYVEAGAFIATGRDISIKGGVVGANTELVAGGSVMAKYIQEATVRAEGDVQIGAYLFNASVRAGGRVSVLGMGEGKTRALVGGLVWAGQGIEASSIGSPYSSSTRLVIGVDPVRVGRMEQLRANIAACEERQRRLMEKIGIDTLDMELIRQQLRRTPSPERKRVIVGGLKRIARVAELQESLRKEIEELAESQRRLARQATIVVRNRLFAGVEVRVGEETMMVQEDHEKVRLRLLEEDGKLRIDMGTAR